MGTRATSFAYEIQAELSFKPDHYSETAGIGLYYDSNNWLYAYIGLDDREENLVLSILQAKLGQRISYDFDKIQISREHLELKVVYDYGMAKVFYRLASQEAWENIGGIIDVRYLSDEGVNGEPGEIGGFTGMFNFMGCVDAHQHDSYGEFYYYQVRNK